MSHERESHRETAPDGQPAPARRPAAVPPIAAAGNAAIGRLLSGRGGGDPLPAGFRAEAEAGFGADFSGVRVHTDPDADRLARSVSARAVTTGDDIFFGRGRYQPEARSGCRGVRRGVADTELERFVAARSGQLYRSALLLTTRPMRRRTWSRRR